MLLSLRKDIWTSFWLRASSPEKDKLPVISYDTTHNHIQVYIEQIEYRLRLPFKDFRGFCRGQLPEGDAATSVDARATKLLFVL